MTILLLNHINYHYPFLHPTAQYVWEITMLNSTPQYNHTQMTPLHTREHEQPWMHQISLESNIPP